MWKGGPNATTLAARRAQLQQARQELSERAAKAGRVVLLGAGLVGVELAAELVEHIPQLRKDVGKSGCWLLDGFLGHTNGLSLTVCGFFEI